VDDAAISLTYARNLSLAGNLAAQIGQLPVEGFSNPLWVLLLAIMQRFELGTEAISYLSGALLLLAALRLAFFHPLPLRLQFAFGLTALLVMLQPSILIWSFSGLENALLLCAGTELLLQSFSAATGCSSKRNAIAAGIASSIVVLTRPEGIIYIALYPLVVWSSRHRHPINRVQIIWAITLPLIAWALYEIFRRLYFGEWVPNTYYAKGSLTISRFVEVASIGPLVLNRIRELAESLFGWVGAFWASIATALLVRISLRSGNAALLLAPCLMMLLSIVVFVLLPGDWMGEQRFATLFYPAVYLLITLAILASPLSTAGRTGLLAALLLWSVWQSIDRMHRFSEQPVISMKEVEDRSTQFEAWAAKLGIQRASLMTADVGGLLWRNKLEVIDLGMLTDRTIALALGEGSPHPDIKAFHHYVFEVRKPNFIATRAYHSWIARLDDDPRFRRDYVPLREYVDGWILRRYGEERFSGDYVRRDLISNYPEQLATLKTEAAALLYPFCKECPPYVSTSAH